MPTVLRRGPYRLFFLWLGANSYADKKEQEQKGLTFFTRMDIE
jgi:hypothetical protein